MIHSRILIQVGCKIIGLFFLASAASMIAFIPQGTLMILGEKGTPTSTIYSYFALPIMQFIFAFIFLKYAAPIAEKLDNSKQDISISPDENWPTTLYHVGIRLLGVYFVIKGLPDVIAQASHMLLRYETVSKLPIYAWGPLFATGLSFAFGLHLLAGGSLLHKLTDHLNQHDD